MGKLIKIIQPLVSERRLSSALVNKIYNILHRKIDMQDDSIDLVNSNMIGEITLNGATYQEYIEYINDIFANLTIHPTAYYMLFQDTNVETIMKNYLLGKGIGDGIAITYEDANNVNVTSLPSFKGNTDIEYFNELVNFSRITSLNGQFTDCTNLKQINIQNITSFGNQTFYKAGLISITLGTVETIPIACFAECPNIEYIYGGSIKTIQGNAFQHDSLLKSIDLSNCTSISNNAFNGCSSLGTIDLSSCTTLGSSAFASCTNLNPINTSRISTINQFTFGSCSNIESISLGSINSFPNNCFYQCTKLKTVTHTGTISSVGSYAFYDDTELTSVDISNCTVINSYAFKNCSKLDNIDLSSCIRIYEYAFDGCSSLTTVDLRNLSEFNAHIFSGCTSLTHVDFPSVLYFVSSNRGCEFDGCTSLGIGETLELTIGSGMGARTFYNTKYNKLILHANAEYQIGDYRGSGQYCSFSHMTSCLLIDLSDTVYTTPPEIGSCWNDGVLQTIIYPKTMTLYNRSFQDIAYTVINVIFLSETYVTPNIDRMWAYYRLTNKSNFHIYVKDDLLDQYLADENWAPKNQSGISLSSIFRTWSDIPSGITWYTKEHTSIFNS